MARQHSRAAERDRAGGHPVDGIGAAGSPCGDSDGRPERTLRAVGEARYRLGERDMILKALAESKGVVAGPKGAAATLGLKRTTLQSKMRKLGIKRPSY